MTILGWKHAKVKPTKSKPPQNLPLFGQLPKEIKEIQCPSQDNYVEH